MKKNSLVESRLFEKQTLDSEEGRKSRTYLYIYTYTFILEPFVAQISASYFHIIILKSICDIVTLQALFMPLLKT